ncbi:aminoglycoside phosphotransferase (APT) family kinase protein [Nocardia tenerifensis]|uniref:Aminoglycoside phosphotransferase (APT) family kinase protein n=1 Tax=Nocardia tenerifensis TaxID=228006 RepID=A0A318KMP9_9NOCA|nr:phosphotransferase family protein [Nocardia tenerifensis]PXX70970.1 aminoglycoside phosphotransferase (APT) family kinase protein [Nocardia tenerifensis]
MSERADTDLPGLPLDRLAAWLSTTLPGLCGGPLRGRVIAGGRSNLTYAVSDGTSEWIVRRPPLGHVLATAHDMGREFRVMSALAVTEVPVPATYAVCTDSEVLGAPFYVMEYVAGTPFRSADELAALGADRTRAISVGMVDALAALHCVDPATVGLADFGHPRGFLERQVHRWKKQLDASYCRELPAAVELFELLAARRPEQSPDGIVHGDYRLDNILVDSADRVAAIIDWEMATLGDPLTDVALLLLYQRLGVDGMPGVSAVALAPGFLTEDELLDRYAVKSGRDLADLGFYLGLAAFKLAAILEGIHYRYLRGKTVGPGFENIGGAVEPMLATGIAAVKENNR